MDSMLAKSVFVHRKGEMILVNFAARPEVVVNVTLEANSSALLHARGSEPLVPLRVAPQMPHPQPRR